MDMQDQSKMFLKSMYKWFYDWKKWRIKVKKGIREFKISMLHI
jgi:hypothetical protein